MIIYCELIKDQRNFIVSMDLTDEINFGDLQKHERYKKLQRDLKLARIKQTKIIEKSEFSTREKFKINSNLKSSGLIQSSLWPSCSSINVDPSDCNSTVTSSTLQVSRSGSEVLASSRHLRNLISRRSILHNPMTTSSVKQYSETDQTTDDRAIMPPPSSSNIIRPPAKRLFPSNNIVPPNPPGQPPSLIVEPSHGKQSFSKENSSIDLPQDQSRGKPVVRDFYRWRVVLNDQGQLLIKGSLDSGKIARSKPVLKMLSSTKLESIYKHTYCLHGNIIDERNELPKYIYTKFYSGFPDDWENVHQIWKNYIAQGSRESYRWPMDVSFSDDDLNSEITDVTHIHRSSETKFQEPSSIDKSTPHRSSGYSSDIQQERNLNSSENLSRDVNLKDRSRLSNGEKIIEVLGFSNETENSNQMGSRSEIENRNQDESRSLGENRSGHLYTALNYAQTLKDFIFEDKLIIITQNLLNENCSREYVRYVNDTIENLNYLISCKIDNLDETEVKRRRIESKDVSHIAEGFQKNCSTPLFIPDEQILNASTHVPGNGVVERISNFHCEKQNEEKYEVYPKMINSQILNPQIPNPNLNCDMSESETYAGVPKISLDRIFQLKTYHSRYKERKMEQNSKSNTANLNAKDCRNNLSYDSSVSLTEEEIQKNNEFKASKVSSNSNISQFRMKPSKVSGERTYSNPDLLTQSRTSLEVMRKTYLEENRKRIGNSSTTPNSCNANLISLDSENNKILSDKENIEANEQPEVSEVSQMKEAQSMQRLEVNNYQRGKHKPTIVNSEISFVQKSKQPHTNQSLMFQSDDNRQEQREKYEGFINATFLKSMETFQNSEKNVPENQEISGNDSFGSQKNPKLLESWTPNVTFDGKNYHLVFEGILLNAVGRPMKKKFTSNHVVRRVSSKVIETENCQFYKLIGDLHNAKHVVPKELLPHCRNGCPAKIDHFCATWVKLAGENNVIVERSQQSIIELSQNVQSSSRGRLILPPLNYWTGERVVMKDDNAVYKPADPKEYFAPSVIKSPKNPRNPQDQENQADMAKETGRKCTSKKLDKKFKPNLSNEKPLSSPELGEGSPFDSERIEHLSNNEIAHKLTFSSSDNEEAQEKHNTRLKRKSQKSFDSNESSSRRGKNAYRQNENSKTSNSYGLRKRQKINHKEYSDIESDTDLSSCDEREKKKMPVKSRPTQIRCTYKKNIPVKDALLSDDQLSVA